MTYFVGDREVGPILFWFSFFVYAGFCVGAILLLFFVVLPWLFP